MTYTMDDLTFKEGQIQKKVWVGASQERADCGCLYKKYTYRDFMQIP